MPIPDVSHLQFAVLAILLAGESSGVDLRAQLGSLGFNHTRAAFYQLMARLEENGFVEGRYEKKVVDDITIKERIYLLTALGQRVVRECREFYAATTFSPAMI